MHAGSGSDDRQGAWRARSHASETGAVVWRAPAEDGERLVGSNLIGLTANERRMKGTASSCLRPLSPTTLRGRVGALSLIRHSSRSAPRPRSLVGGSVGIPVGGGAPLRFAGSPGVGSSPWACRNAPHFDDLERSGDPDDEEERRSPRSHRSRGVASDRSGAGVVLVGRAARPRSCSSARITARPASTPPSRPRSTPRSLATGSWWLRATTTRRTTPTSPRPAQLGTGDHGGVVVHTSDLHIRGHEPRHGHRGRDQGGRADAVQLGPAGPELRPGRRRQGPGPQRDRGVEGERREHREPHRVQLPGRRGRLGQRDLVERRRRLGQDRPVRATPALTSRGPAPTSAPKTRRRSTASSRPTPRDRPVGTRSTAPT